MKNASLVKHAVLVGVFVVVLYVACLLWRYTMTDPAVMQLHLLSLKSVFPGFQGFDAMSILWGGVMSFGYGFVFSFIFHTIHGNCACEIRK